MNIDGKRSDLVVLDVDDEPILEAAGSVVEHGDNYLLRLLLVQCPCVRLTEDADALIA